MASLSRNIMQYARVFTNCGAFKSSFLFSVRNNEEPGEFSRVQCDILGIQLCRLEYFVTMDAVKSSFQLPILYLLNMCNNVALGIESE